MRRPPTKVDIGSKIRDWTVLEFDTSKKKGRNYLCQCKCGKILSKPIGDLIRRGPEICKSCACKFRDFGSLGTQALDLNGKIFGSWTVIERVFNEKNGSYWKCQCVCGEIHEIFGPELKRGKTTKCRSCACRKKATKHGCGTRGKIAPEYNSWAQMKSRCLNPNDKRYQDWGARGIKVFPEWIDSFEKFLEYVGRKPTRSHSIDRINNDGNYEPGNVRWATPKEQACNRRKK